MIYAPDRCFVGMVILTLGSKLPRFSCDCRRWKEWGEAAARAFQGLVDGFGFQARLPGQDFLHRAGCLRADGSHGMRERRGHLHLCVGEVFARGRELGDVDLQREQIRHRSRPSPLGLDRHRPGGLESLR
jgi:hypothetical protein